MKKVYIVCWGSACSDDDGNARAYSNVHGVYAHLDDAEKAMIACKYENYVEIVENPDYTEEERELARVNTSVYGSVEDGYFEIDYFEGETPCEIYINIVVKEINE